MADQTDQFHKPSHHSMAFPEVEEVLKKTKQVNEILWEIPQTYKQGMRVPARIYATEHLLKEFDRAVFDQLTNIATLPGIVKHALCMPDGHSGYGFPIGGVAAFDPETGIISPGGIGFDINCLHPETRILTEYGYYKRIKDMTECLADKIACMDLDSKHKKSARAALSLKKRADHRIFRIATDGGEELILSEDHPIYTGDQMICARDLKESQPVVVCPFMGVEFEQTGNKVILDKAQLAAIVGDRDKVFKELEARGLLPLTAESEALPILARLVGFLTGDGWLGCYYSKKRGLDIWSVRVTGKNEDLELVRRDFQQLGYDCNYIRTATCTSQIVETDGTLRVIRGSTTQLHVGSQSLSMLLHLLGVPKGNKSRMKVMVPSWIKESPLWIKRLYLAGFFGAELTKPIQRKNEPYGFTEPHISQNKIEALAADNANFLFEIRNLLKEFGIEVNKIYRQKGVVNSYGEQTYKLAMKVSAKTHNLITLWGKIGYEYSVERKKLSMLALAYLKRKHHVLDKTRAFLCEARAEAQAGTPLREILTRANNEGISSVMVCGQMTRQSQSVRITHRFPTFKEYAALHRIEDSEFVLDEIKEIQEVDYDGYIYDFTMDDEHHNFVANSIVTHNCGMRLVKTNLSWKDVEPKLKPLVDELFRAVPSGVGMGGFVKLNKGQLDEVSTAGAKWCIENGYGWKQDLENIEDNGTITTADPAKVSDRAKTRGIGQLGTLGSGNHYLEVQVIDEKNIFDAKLAKKFGLFAGQVCVMVHCGSRGFGHQIGTDYLEIFLKKAQDYGITLVDKELACAPFQSREGQDYFKAMPCAANLAFANRQVILHRIRESFAKIFGQDAESLGMEMVYDVAHNIAKLEKHVVDGEKKEVLVHRKGATRCFGPGRKELAAKFQETGQPVIIGGSMETGSHLLVGTKKAELETWGSTMHGSGRTMSRTQAKREVNGEALQKDMLKRGIYVRTASYSGLAEEAGFAYKNISEVVDTMEVAGISHKVVAFTPKGNVKG
ncbi:RtcB family protein [Candidatus Woesearchaeota archaeon]|nr:RtcB family protein [Candidatus Woesearchaeota archaeon]